MFLHDKKALPTPCVDKEGVHIYHALLLSRERSLEAWTSREARRQDQAVAARTQSNQVAHQSARQQC